MALLVVPVAVYSFFRGYKEHHHPWTLVVGLVGVFILVLGASLPHLALHKIGHTTVTILGSCFLIFAHSMNWYQRKHGRRTSAPRSTVSSETSSRPSLSN